MSYGVAIPSRPSASGKLPSAGKMSIAFLAPMNDDRPMVMRQTISPSSDFKAHGPSRVNVQVSRPMRPPRPSYSEEQKFFIVFARVTREMAWPDIEEHFYAHFGGPRTKGGLTSVYYRIRRSWGLEEVLSGGPGMPEGDKRCVEEHAGGFSREFLTSIGYLNRYGY